MEINFNDPIEALVIFRTPNLTGGPPVEHGSNILFCWEDIRVIEDYMYDDDWLQYKGPKYFVTLYGDSNPKLVFGSYNSMKTYWTMFKNKFGQFADRPGKDEDED